MFFLPPCLQGLRRDIPLRGRARGGVHRRVPDGKLYLRAEIEELPPLRGIAHSDRWNKLVRRWSEHIVAIDSLVRASGMGLEDVLPIMEGEFLPYTESGLWSACQSILDGYDDRQQALSSEEASQVIDVLENALEEKQGPDGCYQVHDGERVASSDARLFIHLNRTLEKTMEKARKSHHGTAVSLSTK